MCCLFSHIFFLLLISSLIPLLLKNPVCVISVKGFWGLFYSPEHSLSCGQMLCGYWREHAFSSVSGMFHKCQSGSVMMVLNCSIFFLFFNHFSSVYNIIYLLIYYSECGHTFAMTWVCHSARVELRDNTKELFSSFHLRRQGLSCMATWMLQKG